MNAATVRARRRARACTMRAACEFRRPRLAAAATRRRQRNMTHGGGGRTTPHPHTLLVDLAAASCSSRTCEGGLGAGVRCAAAMRERRSSRTLRWRSARSLAEQVRIAGCSEGLDTRGARHARGRPPAARRRTARAWRTSRRHGEFDATRCQHATAPSSPRQTNAAPRTALPGRHRGRQLDPRAGRDDATTAEGSAARMRSSPSRRSSRSARRSRAFVGAIHRARPPHTLGVLARGRLHVVAAADNAGAVGAKAAEEGWRRGRLSQGLTCISGVDPALLPPSLPRGGEDKDRPIGLWSPSPRSARAAWRGPSGARPSRARVCVVESDGSAASAALVGARITVVHVLDPASNSSYSRSFDATSWEGAFEDKRAVGAAIDASGACLGGVCVARRFDGRRRRAALRGVLRLRVRRVLVFTPQTGVATYEAVRRRDFGDGAARLVEFLGGVVGGGGALRRG